MTKTLTEQWREGTLPLGTYYIINKNGDEEIDRSIAVGELWNNSDLKEVLAPVPSYDEIKRLQEQLNEANKLLKYCCANYESSRFGATITEDGEILPKGPVWNYLKKWKV